MNREECKKLGERLLREYPQPTIKKRLPGTLARPEVGLYSAVPVFLYPNDCEIRGLTKLVKALECRDFIIPNVSVTFNLSHTMHPWFKNVFMIDWKEDLDTTLHLWFSKTKGLLP